MAGRKQHYIPQLLSRGFSRPGDGKHGQVSVFSREHGTYSTSTEGVGAQREFYSEYKLVRDLPTLDDKITDYEKSLGEFVMEVREKTAGQVVDTRRAAEAVIHLCVRVSHVRDSFSSAFVDLLLGVQQTIAEPGYLMKKLKLHENVPGKIVSDLIRDTWKENKTALIKKGFSKSNFKQIFFNEIKTKGESLFTGSMPMLSEMIARVNDQMTAIARRGHVTALENSLAPEPRVQQLSTLEWRVEHAENGSCILPDCIAVAAADDGLWLPISFVDGDAITSLLMPISHNRVLIGLRAGLPQPPLLDLNAVSAASSWDMFIARDDDPKHHEAMQKIGFGIRSYLKTLVADSLKDA